MNKTQKILDKIMEIQTITPQEPQFINLTLKNLPYIKTKVIDQT